MLIRRALLSLICLPTCLFANSYTLNYYPAMGSYTAKLYVGRQKNPVDVLIDTGSSNLNFVSTKTDCKHCHLKRSLLSIKKSHIKQSHHAVYFEMHYGLGGGILQPYEGKVGFSPTQQVNTTFSVFKSGKHLSSILGLAYQSGAAPQLYPLKPFFNTLGESFGMNGFALTLCRQKPSHLTLGIKNKNFKHAHYTPIIFNRLYLVSINGIYGQARGRKQKIISYGKSPMLKTAILDSGTTGMIYLPAKSIHAITRFVQSHTSKSIINSLPKSFWSNNECLNNALIDKSKFPDLYIAFAKLHQTQHSFFVKLTPDEYINEGGCGQFSSHFVFAQTPNKLHKGLYYTDMPHTKILGTPVFENHTVIFDRELPSKGAFKGKIGFLEDSCQ